MAADLLTLAELRTFLGIDPTDTRDDAMYEAMIPAVSQVIRNYTGRDFGAETVTEERTFDYDGSGFLDIDDADEITQVAFVVPNSTDYVLDADAWRPMPVRRDDAPVYTYISIYTSYPWALGSPQMGFTRNLDVIAAEGRLGGWTSLAKVTGTWGWPDVPVDVKMAAYWTIKDWKNSASAEGLTAEAIEGFSRSWGGRAGGSGPSLAIPNKARDILANYQKTEI